MPRHEELAIPIFSNLEPVYSNGSHLEEAELGFKNLKCKFLDLFGQTLIYICSISRKIPTGSGLSNSAAFVCASTIAIMASVSVNMPKKEMTLYLHVNVKGISVINRVE
ncbi:hypothetical protein MTR67_009100 [Solanum verrucosum]|uniref:GHMP kinase N-terminal domain-containing protein n=1 Tax=Solanum verrucosum TaxID=315347 RepID=A0AAF0TK02_SOLVR|nr:hypothetical protein MTR67_009100 [Solanum verrucosum]